MEYFCFANGNVQPIVLLHFILKPALNYNKGKKLRELQSGFMYMC